MWQLDRLLTWYIASGENRQCDSVPAEYPITLPSQTTPKITQKQSTIPLAHLFNSIHEPLHHPTISCYNYNISYYIYFLIGANPAVV